MAEKSLYEILRKTIKRITFAAVTAISGESAVDIASGAFAACRLNGWSDSSGGVQSDFTLASGALKCNFDGLIEVSGSVYISANSTGGCTGCYIYKGNTEVASTLIESPGASGRSVAPKIIRVSDGDLLYLKGRVLVSAGKLYQSNAATYLTVKRIS